MRSRTVLTLAVVASVGGSRSFRSRSPGQPGRAASDTLEAATRAYARIIDEVNKLPLSDLQRPPDTYRPRIDFASCPAWVADSSAACATNTERACAITAAGC